MKKIYIKPLLKVKQIQINSVLTLSGGENNFGVTPIDDPSNVAAKENTELIIFEYD